jgi:hypothetical protein
MAAAATRPQDTLLVILAGSGDVVEGKVYLAPHDMARPGQWPADLVAGGISLSEIIEAMVAAKALNRALVVDLASTEAEIVRDDDGPFALRGAVERAARPFGVDVLAAVVDNANAAGLAELGHGLLSFSLLAAGGAEGVNAKEGEAVDAETLFNFVHNLAARLAESIPDAQAQVHASVKVDSAELIRVAQD